MMKGYTHWLSCIEAHHLQYDSSREQNNAHTMSPVNGAYESRGSGNMHMAYHQESRDKEETQTPHHPSKLMWRLSHPLREDVRGNKPSPPTSYQQQNIGVHPAAGRVQTQVSGGRSGIQVNGGESEQSHGDLHASSWQRKMSNSYSSPNGQVESEGQDLVPTVDHYQKTLDSWSDDDNTDSITPHGSTNRRHRQKARNHHYLNHPSHSTPNQAHLNHRNSKTLEFQPQQSREPNPHGPVSNNIMASIGQGHPKDEPRPGPSENEDVWFTVPGDVTVNLSKL